MIISQSPRRNHKMCVYHNTTHDGKIESITRHEPIDPTKPCIRRKFKGREAAKGGLL